MAHHLEIISKTFPTNQNTAHGIYDSYQVINHESHMRILKRLVLNRKFLELISRSCATLSAVSCTYKYMSISICMYVCKYVCVCVYTTWPTHLCSDVLSTPIPLRGGGLGSRPKKMYGERLGDGVEYHLMKPTPRR